MFTIDQIDREEFGMRIDTARELAIDLEAVLKDLSIQRSWREVRAGYGMTADQYLQLQSRLGAAIRTALHAQAGVRSLAVDEQEIVYSYMLGARDLHEALQRMVKFAAMLQERLGGFRIELDIEQAGQLRLALYSGIVANIEQRFASYFCHQHNKLIESLAWMIDKPIALYRVDVPFPPTPHAETYLQRFRCPIKHAAPCFAFYFDPALLQAPIARSTEELGAYLRMLPAVLSEPVASEDFGARVERLMEKQCLEIGGIPTLTELAALLNVSVTTLRRRLNEHGRSYSEIKHDCRLRLSKELLAKPYRKVFDIAQRLGYSDANAFRRVFKQATGQTPAGYHKNCQRTELVGS